MTREEAIERLNIHKSTSVFVDSIAEAIDMAIEALSADADCSTCKHKDKDWDSEECDSCCGNNNHYASADAESDDLIIKGAKGIQDGLYNIKDGKLFKYKGKGGTVRTYPIVPSADAVHGWIPFKKRPLTDEEKQEYPDWTYIFDCPLPDDEEEILLSNGKYVWTDTFINDGECYLDGGDDIDDGMAWMPLPKPYREDGE